MNKLDKQFGELMKNVRIESPSSNFTLSVMSRIQAEVAVTRKPLLQDYQPVISKRTWWVISIIFIGLIIYISVSGGDNSQANVPDSRSLITESLSKLNSGGLSFLSHGLGIFSGIPAVAYLIVLASLALWTLDSFLNRLRHNPSKTGFEQ
jgi:hypothetical protein